MIVAPIARPIGDGGVSTISSAAGRKASSCSRRRTGASAETAMIFLADFMDAGLQVVQLRIAAVGADQLVMVAVLDDAAALDGDDAVGVCARSTADGR